MWIQRCLQMAHSGTARLLQLRIKHSKYTSTSPSSKWVCALTTVVGLSRPCSATSLSCSRRGFCWSPTSTPVGWPRALELRQHARSFRQEYICSPPTRADQLHTISKSTGVGRTGAGRRNVVPQGYTLGLNSVPKNETWSVLL